MDLNEIIHNLEYIELINNELHYRCKNCDYLVKTSIKNGKVFIDCKYKTCEEVIMNKVLE